MKAEVMMMKLLSCLAVALVVVEGYKYEVHFFEQTLDHFDFFNQETFQQQYLVNDTWWKKPGTPGGPGPIFFYTGNEGPIGLFANNTGLMWDLAPEFNALLVFGEHRFVYGETALSSRPVTCALPSQVLWKVIALRKRNLFGPQVGQIEISFKRTSLG